MKEKTLADAGGVDEMVRDETRDGDDRGVALGVSVLFGAMDGVEKSERVAETVTVADEHAEGDDVVDTLSLPENAAVAERAMD